MKKMTKQVSIQITIGSAPSYLQRYGVVWAFANRSKQYVFNSSGGVIKEEIIVNDEVELPDSIPISITIDFSPTSGLNGYKYSQEIKRENTLYSYFFEIGQIVRAAVLAFDCPWDWVGTYSNDYLFVKWRYVENTQTLFTGLFDLRSSKLQEKFIQNKFSFLQDPEGLGFSGDLCFEITGRLHDWPVVRYSECLSLSRAEYLVIRPEFKGHPSRFLLKVVS